uniref:DDE-1 domain-containing protein n=1 Tax=Ditylenchus dipsaci TaxID=166011 RepID=A0A915DPB9_9BILA
MVPKEKFPGGGRPLLDQDFDNGLAGWVRERRAMKQKVSRTMIVARAEKMFQPTFGSEKKTFFEFTARNNPRAPAVDVYLQWIYEGWQSLTKEAIASSFKTCADGSEDDEIHCFKQHGPASGGRLLLKQARENTEIDALIPEEIDIEEDAGNGYESDVSLEWNVM